MDVISAVIPSYQARYSEKYEVDTPTGPMIVQIHHNKVMLVYCHPDHPAYGSEFIPDESLSNQKVSGKRKSWNSKIGSQKLIGKAGGYDIYSGVSGNFLELNATQTKLTNHREHWLILLRSTSD